MQNTLIRAGLYQLSFFSSIAARFSRLSCYQIQTLNNTSKPKRQARAFALQTHKHINAIPPSAGIASWPAALFEHRCLGNLGSLFPMRLLYLSRHGRAGRACSHKAGTREKTTMCLSLSSHPPLSAAVGGQAKRPVLWLSKTE